MNETLQKKKLKYNNKYKGRLYDLHAMIKLPYNHLKMSKLHGFFDIL